MKILSLFSGIGAFEKALKNLGVKLKIVGTSEVDKEATVSYAAIYNGLTDETIENYDFPSPTKMANYLKEKRIDYDFKKDKPYDWDRLARRKNKKLIKKYYLASVLSKNYGDITAMDLDNLPKCDMITHGSPCQDFSVAGLGGGGGIGSGTRSSLMWNSVEIIRRCKPKFVVWENVKGVLSKRHKHNFDLYIQTLDDMGYSNYYEVLNAKDYGIPQNRERIFVVSIRKDIDNGIVFPKPFDNGLRLKDVLEDVVDERFYISEEKCGKLISQIKSNQKGTYPSLDEEPLATNALSSREHRSAGWKEEVSTLCARDYKDPKCVAIPCLTPDRENKRQNGISNTLTTVQKDNYLMEPQGTLALHNSKEFGNGYMEGVAKTLRPEKHDCAVAEKKAEIKPINLKVVLTDGREAKEISKEMKPSEANGFITSCIDGNYSYDCNRSILLYGKEKSFDECSVGKIKIKISINDNVVFDEINAEETAKVAVREATKQGHAIAEEGDSINIQFPNSKTRRGRVGSGIAQTLETSCNQATLMPNYRIRKLTPKECFRLMGFTDDDFQKCVNMGVSNSQLYKQAGNSIVVNVLEAIFANLKETYGLEEA